MRLFILLSFFAFYSCQSPSLQRNNGEDQIVKLNDNDFEKRSCTSIQQMFHDSWIDDIPLIDPAIPSNYLVDKSIDTVVSWGEKNDLDAREVNPLAELNSPIFIFSYSASFQTTPGELDELSFYEKKFFDQLEKSGCHYKINETKWGNYPVRYTEIDFPYPMPKMRIAWVGLNKDGKIMMINCLRASDNKKTEKIWTDFLFSTKEIPESNEISQNENPCVADSIPVAVDCY